MNHNELAADLAGHVKGDAVMVWTDLQLGPSGSPRPDVFTIRKSFVNSDPRAYEVKISRSDFFADTTAGKWQSYLKYAGSVTFAVPAGLITPQEVPAQCGLMVRGDTGWRVRKRATPSPVAVPRDAWMKLLIDGVEREGPPARRRHWDTGSFEKRFGAEAARWVADAAHVKEKVEYAREEADVIRSRALADAERIREAARRDREPLWNDLCAALDLDPTVDTWQVRDAVRKLRAAMAGGVERSVLESIRRQINVALGERS